MWLTLFMKWDMVGHTHTIANYQNFLGLQKKWTTIFESLSVRSSVFNFKTSLICIWIPNLTSLCESASLLVATQLYRAAVLFYRKSAKLLVRKNLVLVSVCELSLYWCWDYKHVLHYNEPQRIIQLNVCVSSILYDK